MHLNSGAIALTLTLIASAMTEEPEAQGAQKAKPRPATATRAATPAGADAARVVEAEMHNVDFHIDDGIVLRIDRLRGELLAAKPNGIPTFDDKNSFVLNIRSAKIAVDMASLETLLNRHVFGYPGSPLRKLKVSVEGDQLVQTGLMRKGVDMPFRIKASLSLTPAGEIRLHPTAVRVAGVGVRRLMSFFGIELQGVVKLKPGHGARIEGDDFILDATAMLPPPRISGRLTAIKVENGRVVQSFGPAAPMPTPLRRADPARPNYMYFRGGTLRFGKLTMADADLAIVDQEPKTTFDFSLANYNAQLVAGYSKSTKALGLVVYMPDFGTLKQPAPPKK